MPETFHGVIVYEIIKNGEFIILNGIYTNNGDGGRLDKKFEINNEIAKRKISNTDGCDFLLGSYNLRYIDNEMVEGKLEITFENEAYRLMWKISINKVLHEKFIGIGLQAGHDRLAVSYVKVEPPKPIS